MFNTQCIIYIEPTLLAYKIVTGKMYKNILVYRLNEKTRSIIQLDFT